MKSRFSTYDLICSVTELQRLIGLRVNQVYDIDNKTYLVKLQHGDNKALLLFESGIRIHTTAFEWPKNVTPSGFSMKLRKHIKNKRLEKLTQLGLDRIVDMQFGSGEAAYHIILELYDKGNIVFTDHSYTILNVLRPHTEGEEVRFVVREKYPSSRGKQRVPPLTADELKQIFENAKEDDAIKKILNPHLVYGPGIIDHVLLKAGFPPNEKLKDIDIENDVNTILASFCIAEQMIDIALTTPSKGYIIQKREKIASGEDFLSNQEFHPALFEQHKNSPYIEFDSFDLAVDEFFSKVESQKIDMKGVQQEKAALKKLANVKKDHEKRISELEKSQEEDIVKAELITHNQKIVDDAIIAVRQLIANQISWYEINRIVKESNQKGDPIASVIKKLKLDINNITLLLSDPYTEDDDKSSKPMLVDVDIDLTAFANAKKYYEKRRQAAVKQQKTVESEGKALKSAERKTKQALKEVKTGVTISKARKVFWFEKFFWFISSENYLVIGGRDQQQNELIVKRYMKPADIYVHAGITGASSVVVKNPSGQPVPPSTLNEAGTMAMCYSTAWDAKVVTSAWWVNANQVSKTAPTGEYLTTGSFMIRGKKNFLPQSHLIMGFSFMFRLEDSCIERHKGERKKRETEEQENEMEEIELNVDEKSDSDDNDSNDDSEMKDEVKSKLATVEELDDDPYPDTEVLVQHRGADYEIQLNNPNSTDSKINEAFDEEESVVYLGDDKPVIIKPSQKRKDTKSKSQQKDKGTNVKQINVTDDVAKPSQPKRVLRGKKKKLQEKYKDQDEEDKQLRLLLLQPAGKKREDKRKRKKQQRNSDDLKPQVREKPEQPIRKEQEADDNEDDDEPAEPTVAADVDMLDCLSGQPVPEDELLFAVPVVAPYNVLTSYKYKVKLTPGTGKRGKAAKLALNLFLKEKAATQREKDLLKFVKDQDLARNFPGKVKVSAPQLTKRKT